MTRITTLHARTIFSDDEGLTWSQAVDLNPQLKRPEWLGLFAASGHGLQGHGDVPGRHRIQGHGSTVCLETDPPGRVHVSDPDRHLS